MLELVSTSDRHQAAEGPNEFLWIARIQVQVGNNSKLVLGLGTLSDSGSS